MHHRTHDPLLLLKKICLSKCALQGREREREREREKEREIERENLAEHHLSKSLQRLGIPISGNVRFQLYSERVMAFKKAAEERL